MTSKSSLSPGVINIQTTQTQNLKKCAFPHPAPESHISQLTSLQSSLQALPSLQLCSYHWLAIWVTMKIQIMVSVTNLLQSHDTINNLLSGIS